MNDKRILAVDDDEAIVEVLETILDEEGYAVYLIEKSFLPSFFSTSYYGRPVAATGMPLGRTYLREPRIPVHKRGAVAISTTLPYSEHRWAPHLSRFTAGHPSDFSLASFVIVSRCPLVIRARASSGPAARAARACH